MARFFFWVSILIGSLFFVGILGKWLANENGYLIIMARFFLWVSKPLGSLFKMGI